MSAASPQVGVIEVYKLKIINHYHTKPIIPLLFYAILAKGASPTYIKYQHLKQNYPQILINFLQKKLQITTNSHNLIGKKGNNVALSHQQDMPKPIKISNAQPQSSIERIYKSNSQSDKSGQSQSKSRSSSSSNYSCQSVKLHTNQTRKPIQPKVSSIPIRSCRLQKQPSPQKIPSLKRFRQQKKNNSKQTKNKGDAKQGSKQKAEKHLDYDQIAIQLYGVKDYLFKYVPVLFLPKKHKRARKHNNKSMSLDKRKKSKAKK